MTRTRTVDVAIVGRGPAICTGAAKRGAVVFAAFCLAGCLSAGGPQVSPPAQPDAKPDFSGTWVFQPDRSSLEIRAPESSIFSIDHQDPHWRLERTHVYDGKEDTLGMELLTDGVPVVREIHGVEVHTRLYWDDDVVVFESSYTRGGKESHTVVRYRLAEEGRTFIAEERLEREDASHRNTWVFERQ